MQLVMADELSSAVARNRTRKAGGCQRSKKGCQSGDRNVPQIQAARNVEQESTVIERSYFYNNNGRRPQNDQESGCKKLTK